MNEGLVHISYLTIDNFLHNSLHRFQIDTLGPTLIQLNADLIDRVLHRSVLWPVRRTTNNRMPTLLHGLVDLGSLVS